MSLEKTSLSTKLLYNESAFEKNNSFDLSFACASFAHLYALQSQNTNTHLSKMIHSSVTHIYQTQNSKHKTHAQLSKLQA